MNLWQSDKWAALQRNLGNKTFRLNGVLVVEKKLPFDRCFFEVPRGEASPEFWKKLPKVAEQRRAIFCRVAPADETRPATRLPLKRTAGQRFPDATRIIDLKPEEGAIFSQFSESGRRQVRQAEKSGITVSASTDFEMFAFLSEQTAKRDGFAAHSVEYFRTLAEVFGQDLELLVARKDGKWLSAGIFLTYGTTAVYYYGASSEMFRKLNAPTLLQWEAMKRARDRGCQQFDLLGVAPDDHPGHKLAGVSRFKRKFGGKVVCYYPESNVIFAPGWYYLYRIGRILQGIV